MAEDNKKVEKKRPTGIKADTKRFTTIPNSVAEYSIFTYATNMDPDEDILAKGFFDRAYSFLAKGDTIRVFKYNNVNDLTKYFEFIVVDINTALKTVDVSLLANKNLVNNIIK